MLNRYLSLAVLVLVVFSLTMCQTADIQVDETPPKLESKYPEDGATGVALTDSVQVTFSEEIPPNSIRRKKFSVLNPDSLPVSGTYKVSGKVVKFIPDSLDPNTTYSTKVQGVIDMMGNKMESEHTWSWKTASP